MAKVKAASTGSTKGAAMKLAFCPVAGAPAWGNRAGKAGDVFYRCTKCDGRH